MDRTHRFPHVVRAAVRLAVTGLALSLIIPAPMASAAPTASYVRVIRTFAWGNPSPDPTGLAYLPSKRALVVVDAEVEETPHFEGKNIWFARLRGGVIKAFDTLSFSAEPTDVAIGGVGNAMYVSDDSMDRVFWVRKGPDGAFGTGDDVVSSFSTRLFGSHDPAGLAFGAKSLWVTDGDNETSKQRVYRIRRGPNKVFDGVAPVGDDIVRSFSTEKLGLRRPSDVAYDPETGHLFIVSALDDFIAETTLRGSLVTSWDMSATNIRFPAGIVLAPASNGSGNINVYVADRGLDNDSFPNENDGRIYEFKLTS